MDRQKILACLFLSALIGACGEPFIPTQQDTPELLRWQSTLHLLHDSHSVLPVAHGQFLPQHGEVLYKALPTAIGKTCSQVNVFPPELSVHQLPAHYQVDWSFAQCAEMLTGQRHVEVSLPQADTDLAVSQQASLQSTFANGAERSIASHGQGSAKGKKAAGWQVWQWQESGEQRYRDVDEQLLYHDAYELTWQVEDTFDPNLDELTERIVRGKGSLDSLLDDSYVEIEMDNLLYEPSVCCYPLAGSLLHRSGNGKQLLGYFTTTCRLLHWHNGKERWLPPCSTPFL